MARNAILGLTSLVVVLLMAGYASITWDGYHGALDDAGISTANLATVLDEHAQQTLRLVEVTVESLADTLNSAIETGPLNPDQITPILMGTIPAYSRATMMRRAARQGDHAACVVVSPFSARMSLSGGGLLVCD